MNQNDLLIQIVRIVFFFKSIEPEWRDKMWFWSHRLQIPDLNSVWLVSFSFLTPKKQVVKPNAPKQMCCSKNAGLNCWVTLLPESLFLVLEHANC